MAYILIIPIEYPFSLKSLLPKKNLFLNIPYTASSLSNQYLEVGTDGTIYIHTTIRKSPGQTGVLPTTAGALETNPPSGDGRTGYMAILNPNYTLRYATYIRHEEGDTLFTLKLF